MIKTLIVVLCLSFSSFAYACETATVSVNGMVCDFCARAIERVFNKHDEVKNIVVDLDNSKILVNFNNGQRLSDSQIAKLIQDAGYDLVDIEC